MRLSLLVLLLVLFVCACGSSPSLNNSGARNTKDPAQSGEVLSTADSAEAHVKPYSEDAQAKASWDKLENDPGIPGYHYDPQRIFVQFDPLGDLPAGWAPASPAAAAAAVPSGNRFLVDENPRFIPLAAAVAERYGLKITMQLYVDDDRLAFFQAPEGTDVAALMQRMRSEGKGLIVRCAFEPLRHAMFTPNDPDYTSSTGTNYGPCWGHHRVKAGNAWDYTLGSPDVWLADCDTGVRYTHQELAGNVFDPAVQFPTYKLDVINDDNTPTDSDGHGTFIAGILNSVGNNNRTMLGIAPGCKTIPIKISNGGTTGLSHILAGLELARKISDDFGKRVVVNLSWGSDNSVPAEKTKVDSLTNNTPLPVLVVVAAGNDNTAGASYPSGYDNALSVGATGTGTVGGVDARSPFSNYGNYVDVAAPGVLLKSTRHQGDADYENQNNGAGTSYACPIVAAAAGLLWSYSPNLSIAEIRAAIEDTGDPTTGFTQGTVLRLNIQKAFESIAGVRVTAPKLDKLIQSGTVQLTPTAGGGATSVSCRLNGTLVGTLDTAPYTFDVDTSGIGFGRAVVEFSATDGTDVATDTVEFIADNSVATYPLAEYFNAADTRVFEAVDMKGYSTAALTAIKLQDPADWTADTVAAAGDGSWSLPVTGGFQGMGAYMGMGGNSYDNFDIDVLVSRGVNLAGVVNPTLVFQHRYNIENGGSQFDKARVLVTADGGLSWTAAKLGGTANPAIWSGFLASYTQADVDLSDFAGQTVHVALVFEADSTNIGEDTGQPKGWWVDSLILSRNYSTAIPTAGGIVTLQPSQALPLPEVSPARIAGKALNIASFDVNLVTPGPTVTRALYWLDLAPYGTLGFDPTKSVTAPNFLGNLAVPQNIDNQTAILRVQYFDAANNPGVEFDVPLHIFNLRGDTNADGTVNQADFDFYNGKIGLGSSAPGYSIFLDSDLDGRISEADAAAVGYFWGQNS